MIKKLLLILIVRLINNQCLKGKIQNIPRTSTHFEDYKELDYNFFNWKEVKIEIFGLEDIKDTKPSFVKNYFHSYLEGKNEHAVKWNKILADIKDIEEKLKTSYNTENQITCKISNLQDTLIHLIQKSKEQNERKKRNAEFTRIKRQTTPGQQKFKHKTHDELKAILLKYGEEEVHTINGKKIDKLILALMSANNPAEMKIKFKQLRLLLQCIPNLKQLKIFRYIQYKLIQDNIISDTKPQLLSILRSNKATLQKNIITIAQEIYRVRLQDFNINCPDDISSINLSGSYNLDTSQDTSQITNTNNDISTLGNQQQAGINTQNNGQQTLEESNQDNNEKIEDQNSNQTPNEQLTLNSQNNNNQITPSNLNNPPQSPEDNNNQSSDSQEDLTSLSRENDNDNQLTRRNQNTDQEKSSEENQSILSQNQNLNEDPGINEQSLNTINNQTPEDNENNIERQKNYLEGQNQNNNEDEGSYSESNNSNQQGPGNIEEHLNSQEPYDTEEALDKELQKILQKGNQDTFLIAEHTEKMIKNLVNKYRRKETTHLSNEELLEEISSKVESLYANTENEKIFKDLGKLFSYVILEKRRIDTRQTEDVCTSTPRRCTTDSRELSVITNNLRQVFSDDEVSEIINEEKTGYQIYNDAFERLTSRESLEKLANGKYLFGEKRSINQGSLLELLNDKETVEQTLKWISDLINYFKNTIANKMMANSVEWPKTFLIECPSLSLQESIISYNHSLISFFSNGGKANLRAPMHFCYNYECRILKKKMYVLDAVGNKCEPNSINKSNFCIKQLKEEEDDCEENKIPNRQCKYVGFDFVEQTALENNTNYICQKEKPTKGCNFYKHGQMIKKSFISYEDYLEYHFKSNGFWNLDPTIDMMITFIVSTIGGYVILRVFITAGKWIKQTCCTKKYGNNQTTNIEMEERPEILRNLRDHRPTNRRGAIRFGPNAP